MSRRQRQLDELRRLCGCGAAARAIDLAFGHFADFGPDEDVVAWIADVLAQGHVAEDVRRRFTELTSSR